MKLPVLLFASYADAFGQGRIDVQLPPGASVGELVATLRDTPEGHRLPPAPLISVNRRYADYDRVLQSGDEVAVIPPVAGG